jgi:tRNA-uridine 2-sulfurtransferase
VPAPDGRPRYVLDVQPVSNTVVVGPREALQVRRLRGDRPTWCGPAPATGDPVGVQVRAHGEELPGVVTALDDDAVTVELERAASGVAAGQTLVLYAGRRVVGSATLRRE